MRNDSQHAPVPGSYHHDDAGGEKLKPMIYPILVDERIVTDLHGKRKTVGCWTNFQVFVLNINQPINQQSMTTAITNDAEKYWLSTNQ